MFVLQHFAEQYRLVVIARGNGTCRRYHLSLISLRPRSRACVSVCAQQAIVCTDYRPKSRTGGVISVYIVQLGSLQINTCSGDSCMYYRIVIRFAKHFSFRQTINYGSEESEKSESERNSSRGCGGRHTQPPSGRVSNERHVLSPPGSLSATRRCRDLTPVPRKSPTKMQYRSMHHLLLDRSLIKIAIFAREPLSSTPLLAICQN